MRVHRTSSSLVFGLPGNVVLARLLEEAADDVRVRRTEAQARVLRRIAEIRYGTKSWRCKRRGAARIEATTLGLDIRCVVTSLPSGKVRDAIPRPQPLASAELPTLRLLKVAACITETATPVRIAFATACPQAALFRGVARSLQPAGPDERSRAPDHHALPPPSARNLQSEIAQSCPTENCDHLLESEMNPTILDRMG